MNVFNVLLTGRSKSVLQSLVNELKGCSNFAFSTRVVNNGHFDPLHGLTSLPDALIIILSDYYKEELSALSNRSPTARPSTIVISSSNDQSLMRTAMKAGARDFLSEPISVHSIQETLDQIYKEKIAINDDTKIISVINSKGGCGASFIAANIAYMLASRDKALLIDLNIQFGTQSLYLDITPIRDVVEALSLVKELDGPALEGYLTPHESGLKLLAAPLNKMTLLSDISASNLNTLLSLIKNHYSKTVIDLPFYLDSLSIVALERSSHILIVAQQNLASIRDARKLMRIMQQDLEIPKERIIVVVNRYDSDSLISIEEIGDVEMATIPNNYIKVKESIDHGNAIEVTNPRSKVTSSLMSLANKLSGVQVIQKRSLFSTLFRH